MEPPDPHFDLLGIMKAAVGRGGQEPALSLATRCTLTSPVEEPFTVLSISMSVYPSIQMCLQTKHSHRGDEDREGRVPLEEKLAILNSAT